MRPPKYLGVYSRTDDRASVRKPSGMGAVGNLLSRQRKTLFFVWRVSQQEYAVQRLDRSYQACEEARLVDSDTFASQYTAEPSFLVMPVTTPDMAALPPPSPGGRMGDADFARLERARKGKQLEANMREDFRRAFRSLKRAAERQAAIEALERMARVTENLLPEHKHMFTEFGIHLRKRSMPELALPFSRKAVALAPDDDHAHFNLARILCALGAYDEALAHVETAMRLDHSEKVYPRLRTHIQKEKLLKLARTSSGSSGDTERTTRLSAGARRHE